MNPETEIVAYLDKIDSYTAAVRDLLTKPKKNRPTLPESNRKSAIKAAIRKNVNRATYVTKPVRLQ